MNAASRTGNRLVLVLLALVGLAVATAAGWPLLRGESLPLAQTGRDLVASLGLTTIAAAWILAVALLVAVLSALVWMVRRGRGRTRNAVEDEGLVVSTGLVEGLAREALVTTPDVVGVHASTHRRRGERTVRLSLQLRPRADLVATVAQVRAAIDDVDTALGRRLPMVVHLTTGVRTVLARGRRAD